MEIHEIAEQLKSRTLAVCQYLLPDGRVEGSHYRAGSVDGEKGRSLAVDLQEGLFIDQATGEGGDLLTLWSQHFGIGIKKAAEAANEWMGYHHYPLPKIPENPVKPIREKPAPKNELAASSNPYALAYFNGRGLSATVLDRYRIGAQGKTVLMPRFDHELRQVGCKVFVAGDKSTMRQTEGSENVCFGWQACRGHSTLVITEGEIDAMSVCEVLKGAYDVVSVPSGANNLKWLELDSERMAPYSQIIVWMDNDEAGQKNVEQIMNTLGRHRCRSIRSSLKDANEVLTKKGANAVLAELHNADSAMRMGYISIDPEEAADPNIFYKGSIGLFPKLNFYQGTTTLLAGANGTGKSTLALQIAHIMLGCGIKPFILSPEMPPKFTAQILTRQSSDQAIPSASVWKRACEYVQDNFLLSTVDEQITPKTALADFDTAYEMGCRLIILDSITCIKSGGELKDEANFADLLRMWTRAHPDCYFLALAHLRKPTAYGGRVNRYDIRGASQISDLAGHVWLLERKDHRSQKDVAFYGDFDSMLTVDKNRATGENSTTMLSFSPRHKLFTSNPHGQYLPNYLPAYDEANVRRIY